MKSVGIIGGGFVGNAIGKQLISQGKFEVEVINRQKLDLTDLTYNVNRDLFRKLDIIIFSAAKAPCRTMDELEYNLKLIHGFVKLFSEKPPKYILNVSSDAVYPDSKTQIAESLSPNPDSLHGTMHFMRESILNLFFRDLIGHLRPTLIYGPGDPHNGYGPNLFISDALQHKEISLFGVGEEMRDHIYIDDVARIGSEMIRKTYTGALNAASGNVISFLDIANIVCEFVSETKIRYLKRKGPMPHNGYRAFNTSRLIDKDILLSPVPIRNGILSTIEFRLKEMKS